MLFTSRERILVEDWTMQRAPSLPPGLREQPEVCAPRELVYDLPWLLSRASAGASAQTKVSRALSLVDQCARH